MNSYVGTKIIQAELMSEHDFLVNVRKQAPNPSSINRPGYKVIYPDGYASWSPKNAFEHAYRPITEQEKEMIL